MNRDRKIELLDLLKNKQITPERFTEEIENDGKTRFRVIVKKLNGTYSFGGQVYTSKEMVKLNEKVKPNRKITISPKDYNKS